MVSSHQGVPLSEAELMDVWGEPGRAGYTVQQATHSLGSRMHALDLAVPSAFSELLFHLGKGWLIGVMFGGPMTVFARTLEPPSVSPFGPLCSLYQDDDSLMNCAFPLHAVVLTAHLSWGISDPGSVP